MTDFGAAALIVYGVTLALSLAFLLILLWSDVRKELNQFFAAFLMLVLLWNTGALMWQAIDQLRIESPLLTLAIGITELGFTGASVAVYALTAVLVRAHTKRFRVLTFFTLGLIIVYRVILIANSQRFVTSSAYFSTVQRQPIVVAFYLIFDFGALFLLWRNRRKVRSVGIMAGLTLFVIGQTLAFVDTDLDLFQVSFAVSAIASLVLSFSIVAQEIIKPVSEHNSQVEAIRRVGLAITSLASLTSVLEQVARQAAELLKTDGGVTILLSRDGELETAAVYRLPRSFLHLRMPLGEGAAGLAALSQQTNLIDNYELNWKGTEDYPLARQTFGSVVCTPLVYGGQTIGVIMVIGAKHGILFQKEDVYLLELLGAQAAVAISHSQLFSDVEFARRQLETVLISTESPVIAVDRKFHLIFANRTARQLLQQSSDTEENLPNGTPIRDLIPPYALPLSAALALSELRRRGTYTYEATINDRVYLCNIAPLGTPRVTGWVAVMNDVTELKELDRLKSEMVRMTSHDLKNPLQAAMAYTELLRDDLEPAGDQAVLESIDKIDWQLQRMNRIIRGILDLERVKSGVRRFENYPPARAIELSVVELRQFASSQGVQLQVEQDDSLPTIRCDAEQVRRALVNLIENAIKFTPHGGVVSVRAYTQDGSVVFEISDTGVGIAPEARPRVFDRYYRSQQKGTEHITGSGIGLSLVKAVAENHRGKTWLSSEVGKGTTFYISFPVGQVRTSYSQ
mgnify:CR=1 FL=1